MVSVRKGFFTLRLMASLENEDETRCRVDPTRQNFECLFVIIFFAILEFNVKSIAAHALGQRSINDNKQCESRVIKQNWNSTFSTEYNYDKSELKFE